MEIFLDDPNLDVDTFERKKIAQIYILCFLLSIIPPLSMLAALFLSKKDSNTKTKFSKQHFKNILKTQTIVFICSLLAYVILLTIGLFYVLLFGLFVILFESYNTYQGLSAAKMGSINKV